MRDSNISEAAARVQRYREHKKEFFNRDYRLRLERILAGSMVLLYNTNL